MTSDYYIKRVGLETRLYNRFHEGASLLVGVALSENTDMRPVYKGGELLAFMDVCTVKGRDARENHLPPPFASQTSRKTGNTRPAGTMTLMTERAK
jgi:hypothetical protein